MCCQVRHTPLRAQQVICWVIFGLGIATILGVGIYVAYWVFALPQGEEPLSYVIYEHQKGFFEQQESEVLKEVLEEQRNLWEQHGYKTMLPGTSLTPNVDEGEDSTGSLFEELALTAKLSAIVTVAMHGEKLQFGWDKDVTPDVQLEGGKTNGTTSGRIGSTSAPSAPLLPFSQDKVPLASLWREQTVFPGNWFSLLGQSKRDELLENSTTLKNIFAQKGDAGYLPHSTSSLRDFSVVSEYLDQHTKNLLTLKVLTYLNSGSAPKAVGGEQGSSKAQAALALPVPPPTPADQHTCFPLKRESAEFCVEQKTEGACEQNQDHPTMKLCKWASRNEVNRLRRIVGNNIANLMIDMYALEYLPDRTSCHSFSASLFSIVLFPEKFVDPVTGNVTSSSFPACGCADGKCVAQRDWFDLEKVETKDYYNEIAAEHHGRTTAPSSFLQDVGRGSAGTTTTSSSRERTVDEGRGVQKITVQDTQDEPHQHFEIEASADSMHTGDGSDAGELRDDGQTKSVFDFDQDEAEDAENSSIEMQTFFAAGEGGNMLSRNIKIGSTSGTSTRKTATSAANDLDKLHIRRKGLHYRPAPSSDATFVQVEKRKAPPSQEPATTVVPASTPQDEPSPVLNRECLQDLRQIVGARVSARIKQAIDSDRFPDTGRAGSLPIVTALNVVPPEQRALQQLYLTMHSIDKQNNELIFPNRGPSAASNYWRGLDVEALFCENMKDALLILHGPVYHEAILFQRYATVHHELNALIILLLDLSLVILLLILLEHFIDFIERIMTKWRMTIIWNRLILELVLVALVSKIMVALGTIVPVSKIDRLLYGRHVRAENHGASGYEDYTTSAEEGEHSGEDRHSFIHVFEFMDSAIFYTVLTLLMVLMWIWYRINFDLETMKKVEHCVLRRPDNYEQLLEESEELQEFLLREEMEVDFSNVESSRYGGTSTRTADGRAAGDETSISAGQPPTILATEKNRIMRVDEDEDQGRKDENNEQARRLLEGVSENDPVIVRPGNPTISAKTASSTSQTQLENKTSSGEATGLETSISSKHTSSVAATGNREQKENLKSGILKKVATTTSKMSHHQEHVEFASEHRARKYLRNQHQSHVKTPFSPTSAQKNQVPQHQTACSSAAGKRVLATLKRMRKSIAAYGLDAEEHQELEAPPMSTNAFLTTNYALAATRTTEDGDDDAHWQRPPDHGEDEPGTSRHILASMVTTTTASAEDHSNAHAEQEGKGQAEVERVVASKESTTRAPGRTTAQKNEAKPSISEETVIEAFLFKLSILQPIIGNAHPVTSPIALHRFEFWRYLRNCLPIGIERLLHFPLWLYVVLFVLLSAAYEAEFAENLSRKGVEAYAGFGENVSLFVRSNRVVPAKTGGRGDDDQGNGFLQVLAGMTEEIPSAAAPRSSSSGKSFFSYYDEDAGKIKRSAAGTASRKDYNHSIPPSSVLRTWATMMKERAVKAATWLLPMIGGRKKAGKNHELPAFTAFVLRREDHAKKRVASTTNLGDVRKSPRGLFISDGRSQTVPVSKAFAEPVSASDDQDSTRQNAFTVTAADSYFDNPTYYPPTSLGNKAANSFLEQYHDAQDEPRPAATPPVVNDNRVCSTEYLVNCQLLQNSQERLKCQQWCSPFTQPFVVRSGVDSRPVIVAVLSVLLCGVISLLFFVLLKYIHGIRYRMFACRDQKVLYFALLDQYLGFLPCVPDAMLPYYVKEGEDDAEELSSDESISSGSVVSSSSEEDEERDEEVPEVDQEGRLDQFNISGESNKGKVFLNELILTGMEGTNEDVDTFNFSVERNKNFIPALSPSSDRSPGSSSPSPGEQSPGESPQDESDTEELVARTDTRRKAQVAVNKQVSFRAAKEPPVDPSYSPQDEYEGQERNNFYQQQGPGDYNLFHQVGPQQPTSAVHPVQISSTSTVNEDLLLGGHTRLQSSPKSAPVLARSRSLEPTVLSSASGIKKDHSKGGARGPLDGNYVKDQHHHKHISFCSKQNKTLETQFSVVLEKKKNRSAFKGVAVVDKKVVDKNKDRNNNQESGTTAGSVRPRLALPQPGRKPEGEVAGVDEDQDDQRRPLLASTTANTSQRQTRESSTTNNLQRRNTNRSSARRTIDGDQVLEDEATTRSEQKQLEQQIALLQQQRRQVLEQQADAPHGLTHFQSVRAQKWIWRAYVGLLVAITLLLMNQVKEIVRQVQNLQEFGKVFFFEYDEPSGLLLQLKQDHREVWLQFLFVYSPLLLHLTGLVIVTLAVIYVVPRILVSLALIFASGDTPDEVAFQQYVNEIDEEERKVFPHIQTAAHVYALCLSLAAFQNETRKHLANSYVSEVPAGEQKRLERAWRNFSIPRKWLTLDEESCHLTNKDALQALQNLQNNTGTMGRESEQYYEKEELDQYQEFTKIKAAVEKRYGKVLRCAKASSHGAAGGVGGGVHQRSVSGAHVDQYSNHLQKHGGSSHLQNNATSNHKAQNVDHALVATTTEAGGAAGQQLEAALNNNQQHYENERVLAAGALPLMLKNLRLPREELLLLCTVGLSLVSDENQLLRHSEIKVLLAMSRRFAVQNLFDEETFAAMLVDILNTPLPEMTMEIDREDINNNNGINHDKNKVENNFYHDTPAFRLASSPVFTAKPQSPKLEIFPHDDQGGSDSWVKKQSSGSHPQKKKPSKHLRFVSGQLRQEVETPTTAVIDKEELQQLPSTSHQHLPGAQHLHYLSSASSTGYHSDRELSADEQASRINLVHHTGKKNKGTASTMLLTKPPPVLPMEFSHDNNFSIEHDEAEAATTGARQYTASSDATSAASPAATTASRENTADGAEQAEGTTSSTTRSNKADVPLARTSSVLYREKLTELRKHFLNNREQDHHSTTSAIARNGRVPGQHGADKPSTRSTSSLYHRNSVISDAEVAYILTTFHLKNVEAAVPLVMATLEARLKNLYGDGKHLPEVRDLSLYLSASRGCSGLRGQPY
ncbi:unnamed protein product [Amoebophrya sp. A120]|nr:unnamed protein product [Amoebophrya sp. A120]|eukprot:GSA120T00012031001.1